MATAGRLVKPSWPRFLISRCRLVVEEETLVVERGSESYLKRQPEIAPPGLREPELDPVCNFGAELL